MHMPALLNKYPSYTGISVLSPGRSYSPARPNLGQSDIKSTLFLLSFQSLDPTGGHLPDKNRNTEEKRFSHWSKRSLS
jgi:hypothetical protein